MSNVGMNLAPVLYYGTEFPFLDRMKMQSGWSYFGQPAPVDAQGNPLGFPAGASLISTMIPLDPVSAAPTDVYELTYSGAPAAFQIVGATILSTAPGKVVFHYTSTDTTMASLIIRSMSATDPVHDIHVVRQDEVAAFNKGELFNSEFLDQVSHWQTLRFMDWGATNGTTITSWDQRAHVDDASWAQEGNSASVPIEVMIQLANEAHTDMWYNIPTQADDTYVRNALQMIKDRLAPGLKVHVEYSNEVWNSGFQQSQYAQAMANKLWGVDANHDGAITGSEQVTSGNNVYYGYRSAQIAAIANSVFSGVDDNRLEMVFATQNGNSTLERYLLDGIAKAHVGSISALFDEWSVTSYFGLEFSGGSAADRAKVLGWARSGQAGIDAALQELAHGGAGMDTHYSIDDVAQYLAYEKTVADRYGLDLVGYEGGFHGSALYFGADQQTVMDFFARLMADPGMENVYKYWFDTFENAGGKMLAAFNDVQGPSVRGYFGALDTLYDPKTPRYNALLAEAAPKLAAPSGPAAASAPVVAPAPAFDPSVKTTLASATLDSAHKDLTFVGSGAFVGTGNALDNTITGGASDDKLYGAAGNDTLIGGAGADLLDGGVGNDAMTGGTGNDIYIVDSVADVITEKAGEGTDEVRTALGSYTLGANIENLTYLGPTAFTGNGNALDNSLTGGAGSDTLYGFSGKDLLVAGAGNDLLDGGDGADTMIGGTGNDIYIVDNVGDIVTEMVGEGTDEVRTALGSYTLGANLENLTYTGSSAFTGTGNALDNVLVGGAGADRLQGGDGADTLDGRGGADLMIGGAGNDIYLVDNKADSVIELTGGGTDEVRTTLTSYTLGANVENLTYQGGQDFVGHGNALANVLTGGSGGDILDGGFGADRLIGGAGDDLYYVDNAGDVVVEQTGGGNDMVMTSVNYTLAANVENLWVAAGATVVHGNDLANIIREYVGGNGIYTLYGEGGDDRMLGSDAVDIMYGGAGNDAISGGGGNDVLIGGGGNDWLYGGNGADRFVFAPADGVGGDVIADFSNAEGDKIDLRAFDADSATPAHDPLRFIGSAAFTHHAGEIHVAGGSIQIDLNGDGVADFAIYNNSGALVASDFLL